MSSVISPGRMAKTYSFPELCQSLGKAHMYVRNLQTGLDMYIPGNSERYSDAYLQFMLKIVALRTLNISLEDIRDLFIKEKRILEMLHVDSSSDSPTWYLDSCQNGDRSESNLFLTGYDVGAPLHSGKVQVHLNFSHSGKELFSGQAMGEDVNAFCKVYSRQLERLKRRMQEERLVVRRALAWADRVC